jgi:alpha-amylase
MAFNFPAPEWSHSTNIYEINLRQYTPAGTINAFRKYLPGLNEMGVETLWFMPLTPISKKNRKGTLGSYYACSDFVSINPEFGSSDDFKALVTEAHSLGFKVIIDWVANHTGWDHVWTKSNPDYFKRDEPTGDFMMASGMDDIIELDFENDETAEAMIEAMQFWIDEFDIDGFRCDLAFWVKLEFWQKARTQLEKIKPLFWLGEFDELDNPEYGQVFDASYSWTWMHATKNFYHGDRDLTKLISILKNYDDLGDATMRAWFTSNHDENSWNGTEYEKYGDMAGLLAVFSATWNGIPLIYNGQEVSNQKRLAFFEKDPIDWEKGLDQRSFYKKLLDLHRTHPALRGGDPSVQTFRLKTTEPGKVLAFSRKNEDKEIVVVLNFSGEEVSFSFLQDNFSPMILPAWGFEIIDK